MTTRPAITRDLAVERLLGRQRLRLIWALKTLKHILPLVRGGGSGSWSILEENALRDAQDIERTVAEKFPEHEMLERYSAIEFEQLLAAIDTLHAKALLARATEILRRGGA